MDLVKVDEAVSFLLEADLREKFSDSVDAGEGPYQANLKALKLLDIKNDENKGTRELKKAIDGLDKWIKALEIFRDGSKEVAKKGAAALRST